MKNGDIEKAVKLSQSILATQRMDDDVDAWVTINGAHVPLDESGTAIGGAGGAFTGQNLSQAHAASKAASAERAAAKAAKAAAQGSSSSGHTIAEGKDISASYTGSRDTKSVIEAQGFGGLPRVVSSDEFDAAVEASGFVGERIYLASSEKVLEAYQDALYNGDFYVDCTEGGSVYGQGMYCASSYSGEITDDMEGQMGYYSQIGSIRCMQDGEKEYATTLKASDFEGEGFSVTDEQVAVAGRFVTEKGLKVRDLSADEKAAYTSLRKSGQLKDLKTAIDDKIYHDFVIGYEAPSIVEKVTLDTSAKIATYSELKAQQDSSSDAAAKSMDTGAYAAMLGYDAIHVDVASSGGSKADETVILNRTKLIIEDNRGRSDSADENAPISFAEGENGCLYAVQNGKVIGFIDISCSTETKGDQ